MKKYLTPTLFRNALFMVLLLIGNLSQTAVALDVNFYQGNDILYYSPNATGQCLVVPGTPMGQTSVSAGNGANENRDYKGRQIVKDDQLAKIKEYQPIYEKAAAQLNIPWQVFAVLHIRESGLLKGNPANGQGIYQDYARSGNGGKDYTPGPVDDAEFLRQTINAGKILQEKIGSSTDLVAKGDPEAIKDMFFGYNGRAPVYVKQATDLGFDKGYEGSPYVMNIADEKRDPSVNTTTWGQVKVDGGGISYPAGGDYGAFIMYAALAGVPATSGQCSGSGNNIDSRAGTNGWSVTGPNAMVIYYQDEAPWATMPYGGTIKDCGCGPTSVAMAVATLNRDTAITPQTMSNFFVQNGYLNAGCGSNFSGLQNGSALGTKFGLQFTNLGTDLNKAADAVKRGSFVFLSSVGGSPFGGPSGHIMLIRGVTSSGNFLVADPNKLWAADGMSNKTTNEQGFPASLFQSGIQVMYEIRKG